MPGPEWMAIHYRGNAGRRPTPPTFRSGRATTSPRRCKWRWPTPTVANGGVSYYPRLVSNVLNQDGTPVLDERASRRSRRTPKLHSDLRHGFFTGTNRNGAARTLESGKRGRRHRGRARLKDVQVAGKTGTAQACRPTERKIRSRGSAASRRYDHPKYVVVAMVQGGEHGGSVAAPIATRILERTLAMDAGNFEPQLAWLAPAQQSESVCHGQGRYFKEPSQMRIQMKSMATIANSRYAKWRQPAMIPMSSRTPDAAGK